MPSSKSKKQSWLGKRKKPEGDLLGPMEQKFSPERQKKEFENKYNIVHRDAPYVENGVEYFANGLPKNYNSIIPDGVPDGSDPKNPVRVYADGVFDVYHLGHSLMLE